MSEGNGSSEMVVVEDLTLEQRIERLEQMVLAVARDVQIIDQKCAAAFAGVARSMDMLKHNAEHDRQAVTSMIKIAKR